MTDSIVVFICIINVSVVHQKYFPSVSDLSLAAVTLMRLRKDKYIYLYKTLQPKEQRSNSHTTKQSTHTHARMHTVHAKEIL